MKTLFGTIVALFLVIGVSGCTDPKVEFDSLIANAQNSIESDDLDMADAYLADAKLLFPESAVLSETENRLYIRRKSNEALSETLEASASGDWQRAFENAKTIPTNDKNHSQALVSVETAYEKALLESSLDTADISEQEELLTAQAEMEAFGVNVDAALIDSLYQLALNTRYTEIATLFDEGSFEAVMDALESTAGMNLYESEDFEPLGGQAEAAYVDWSIAQTKKLTKEQEFTAASRENKVAMARVPGNALLEAESARISKESAAAAEAKRKAEEAAKQRALNAMYVKEDTFENIKWYFDRNTYSSRAGNKFQLYMGQKGNGTPWLKLRFMMYDSSWHFFERIVVDVDGSKYQFNPGYFEVKRDNYLDIWEWYDHDPVARDFAMIERIIDSESTRIRYINDDNFYEERTVSSAQKKALANVLLAYEALGGKR